MPLDYWVGEINDPIQNAVNGNQCPGLRPERKRRSMRILENGYHFHQRRDRVGSQINGSETVLGCEAGPMQCCSAGPKRLRGVSARRSRRTIIKMMKTDDACPVLPPVHLDDDAEKSADRRHASHGPARVDHALSCSNPQHTE